MKPTISPANLRNALLAILILAVMAVAVWLKSGGAP